jgi:2-methylcitrate dehydratase
MFHTDSVICGISALALRTNAPSVLKHEAMQYTQNGSGLTSQTKGYARCFGSKQLTISEKAICANVAAVREWDSNGTVFGYREGNLRHQAGEFGHNDFYPVAIAAAQQNPDITGSIALKAMLLSDEIRGRLAEVFSLKSYKIDHVVHGAIASAVTYGTLLGASYEQIESAIGMTVAHYIPFRAIRAGKQLSDSKGSSAAISTEAAILSMKRSMMGFVGPKDIFRNPEAIFRYFEKTNGNSPFDLILGVDGEDFAVMGMHFKLGLYEHQSAGAIEGTLRLLLDNRLFEGGKGIEQISNIKIVAYEPAFGIIGDPAKKTPSTRQSADHSMVYIISTLLRKALETPDLYKNVNHLNDLWKILMLTPQDYGKEALHNKVTRSLMEKITFEHGGPEYDKRYPDGIPTSIVINTADGKSFDSKMVMYPSGHARNRDCDLRGILNFKNQLLGRLALESEDLELFLNRLNSIDQLTNQELRSIYHCNLLYASRSIDL